MKSKSIFVALSALIILAGCNSGGSTTSTDVQNNTANNNVAYINIVASGCRIIAASGGTCSVTVNYYAPNGSPAIGSALTISGLNNYNPNISQCGNFSITNKSCVITITSLGSTTSAQQAQIYPLGQQNSGFGFTVGGGM